MLHQDLINFKPITCIIYSIWKSKRCIFLAFMHLQKIQNLSFCNSICASLRHVFWTMPKRQWTICCSVRENSIEKCFSANTTECCQQYRLRMTLISQHVRLPKWSGGKIQCNFFQWLVANKLTYDVSETEYMITGSCH